MSRKCTGYRQWNVGWNSYSAKNVVLILVELIILSAIQLMQAETSVVFSKYVNSRRMNFLHESVIGNFENCSYFYFASYIDPRLWRALFLRVEAMLENISMNSYRSKIINTNILEEKIILKSIPFFQILIDLLYIIY